MSWGAGFYDFDNDADKDLFLVSGHVFPEVDRLNIDVRARDRRILFRNEANGSFTDISEDSGPAVLEKHSSRGVAFGDIDNDGSLEILVNNQNEPPSLLRNARRPAGHGVRLRLEGVRSNRSAIGARVVVTAGGISQTDEVRSGGSYISQSDFRLHFGLGAAGAVDRVEIFWPSGAVQVLERLAADRQHEVREPEANP